jgi:hypothetical protein
MHSVKKYTILAVMTIIFPHAVMAESCDVIIDTFNYAGQSAVNLFQQRDQYNKCTEPYFTAFRRGINQFEDHLQLRAQVEQCGTVNGRSSQELARFIERLRDEYRSEKQRCGD